MLYMLIYLLGGTAFSQRRLVPKTGCACSVYTLSRVLDQHEAELGDRFTRQ